MPVIGDQSDGTKMIKLTRFSWLFCGYIFLCCGGSFSAAMAVQEELLEPQVVEASVDDDQAKPVNKELQRKVRLLQRQLNSDDSNQRDVAETELLALGDEVLDYLADEDPSYAAEFNARLRAIRTRLELNVAENLIKPRTVSLKGQFTLVQLAEQLTLQTGNKVVGFESEELLEVDFDSLGFLEALHELSRLHSTVYSLSGQQVQLLPAAEATVGKHVDFEKGFRTSATSIRSYRNLTSDIATTNLSLQLQWEPRMRLIKLMVPLDKISVLPTGTEPPVEHADDEAEEKAEDGEVFGSNPGRLEFGVSRDETSASFEVPVSGLGSEVDKVDVYGHFRALVAGRNEVFRFSDLDKALENKAELQRSGINVKVVGRQDDEYLTGFQLSISFADSKKSLESHFGWVYENPVFLVDPEGMRHPALTVESAGVDENATSMLFLFDKLEDATGWTLEYHSPGILVETKVPFVLKEIRLP